MVCAAADGPVPARPGVVLCLRCDLPFDSADRCRNRICPVCERANSRVRLPRSVSLRDLEGAIGIVEEEGG